MRLGFGIVSSGRAADFGIMGSSRMSAVLQSIACRRTFRDDWSQLRQTMLDMAEGYAATDPLNGWRYRQEVAAFVGLEPPADAVAWNAARSAAISLQNVWSKRIAR